MGFLRLNRGYAILVEKLKGLPCICLVLSSPAAAEDRTTYSYDALGRMTQYERRVPGAGHQNDYSYDPASNRNLVLASGPFQAEWLNSGDALVRGKAMLSNDRRYKLILQFDGNLVAYDAGNTAIWHASTMGSGADRLVMQSDGNLVLYAGMTPVWYTSTSFPGSRLVVQDHGNLVVYSPNNGPVWARYGCC